jgi:hypothetical protein
MDKATLRTTIEVGVLLVLVLLELRWAINHILTAKSDNFWGIQAGVKQSGKIKFLTKLNIAPVKEKITP